MSVHVVASGENLWSISTRYGVPIHSIISVNGLSSTSLVPGLSLYIPDNTLPIRAYRIQAGDSVWKVAQQFHSSLSLISAANPEIDVNHIQIDQIINIPSMNKLTIITVGFLIPSADTSSTLSIINSLAGQLTYLAVVAYSFTNEGFAYNEIDDSAIVAKCKQVNITPLLLIKN